MAESDMLRDKSVIVVGAGLAGLTAAVALHDRGAKVIVLEARERVGGRVWTLRDGFAGGQHVEAGGDLIEDEHEDMRSLVTRMGLTLTPILRGGFSFVGQGADGRPVMHIGPGKSPWQKLSEPLASLVREYRLTGERWDSLIAQRIARFSVAEWLDHIKADENLRRMVMGLRGFFLADPDDLSLLALVDQLASSVPGRSRMYRIRGGNDLLPQRLAAVLGDGVRRRQAVTAISQTSRAVRVTVRTDAGEACELTAEYLILAVPTTVLRTIAFDPPLPSLQREAIERLKSGRATRTVLQFTRRFWRRRGVPKAFGTALPIGALWDGNEEQGGRRGILSLLAGGSASGETQQLMADRGADGFVRALDWLGAADVRVLASRQISWEQDPWAGGGYAYFDPSYDPMLRPWLARPHGRILFAGEHTSLLWQGYMNGAVESGLRAAAEVGALASPHPRR